MRARWGAVSHTVNGCAAHRSPQVLTLRAETCSLFIEITIWVIDK